MILSKKRKKWRKEAGVWPKEGLNQNYSFLLNLSSLSDKIRIKGTQKGRGKTGEKVHFVKEPFLWYFQ